MEQATTQTGVAQTAIAPQSDEDKFQSLFEAGAFEAPADVGDGETPVPQEAASAASQDAPSKEAETDTPKETAPTYEDFESFVRSAGVDHESVMQLPVTVKVDGKEQKVPLAEAIKNFQLSSAGYARMAEAAQAKESFAREQQQVREALGARISQAESLLKLANDQLLAEYQGIDWNALNQSDPISYARAQNMYQARANQIQQAMQNVQAERQAHAQAQEQARLQALPAEREKLLAARPEWRDQAKLQEAQRSITELGRKMGFTDAELGSVLDHRYMLVLDMAARYAALQAKGPDKLKQVRAAPQMAKPGTRTARDPQDAAYQKAKEAWAKSGYKDLDAEAAVFSSF